ncbi:hypothetical protein [Thermosynechococcus sp. NK55a]|uniref:hypothetical protein n=1 Tax=Thermosynechococcus sp. NK55a TaxID=1394889 RepID=UPI0003FB7B64|nr:hypothetical protein [Thermosynechococcus sp. NK55a]
MTSATVDRQRLQAALACLHLSLEAELTQYRCHRMVQAHSPFEALPVDPSAIPPNRVFPRPLPQNLLPQPLLPSSVL